MYGALAPITAARPQSADERGRPAAPALLEEFVQRARSLASEEWHASGGAELPEALRGLGYDRYRELRFRPDAALWRRDGRPFEVQFHHRGYLFEDPVAILERTPAGATPVPYGRELFDLGALGPAAAEALDDSLGFAGFKLYYPLREPEVKEEIASFLGASYFRIRGEGQSWGASARGLAVDTGLARAEEFPRFVAFQLVRPEHDAREILVHALLDSPGIAGAYALRIAPGPETTVAVSAALFPRHGIEKLGLAPLTSMFHFGESSARRPPDYRPEVHDSDGLLVELADGRRIWRPLTNPPVQHRVSTFEARDPRGFGLMQRDRRFESYQDLESRFETRPSLWVEPLEPFGEGRVELIEIPSPSEEHDNVVAFWVPELPVERVLEARLSYLLRATSADAALHPGLRVLATRRDALPQGGTRFLVDFVGAASEVAPLAGLTASFEGSSTEVHLVGLQPNPVTGGVRVVFDVAREGEHEQELWLRLRTPAGPAAEAWTLVLSPVEAS